MKLDEEKKEFSRFLRRRSTEPETILWQELRNRKFLGIKFRRQKIIKGYIVDFVSLEEKLIIEIDGPNHKLKSIILEDRNRTEVFKQNGYLVVRFWNEEITNNLEQVLASLRELFTPHLTPHPSPLPRRERG